MAFGRGGIGHMGILSGYFHGGSKAVLPRNVAILTQAKRGNELASIAVNL